MPKLMVLIMLIPALVARLSLAQTARPDIPSAIIAMERAALDRSDKGDPDGFLEISDRDVVYMDPALEEPIHGLEALRTYYHKNPVVAGQARGEMGNSKVQVAGDVAVLTFNYATRSQRSRGQGWNATEVYQRTKDGWRIIHTHWSYIKPQRPS
jgi:ketosteroid isomerase-like protein